MFFLGFAYLYILKLSPIQEAGLQGNILICTRWILEDLSELLDITCLSFAIREPVISSP